MESLWFTLIFAGILVPGAFYVRSGRLLLLLGAVHLLYAMVFYSFFGEEFAKDSLNFYQWAISGQRIGFIGTEFIVSIVWILAKVFHLNYTHISAIFSAGAVFGMYFIAEAIIWKIKGIFLKILIMFILCSPSINIFTTYISKESAILFLFGLYMRCLLNRKLYRALLISFFATLVRVYFGAAMFVALAMPMAVWFVFRRRSGHGLISAVYVSIFIAIFLDVAVDIPYLQRYGIDTSAGIMEAIDKRSEIYLNTETGYDPLSYGVVKRVLVYTLGIGDQNGLGGILRLVSALEGIAYLAVMTFAAMKLRVRSRSDVISLSTYMMAMLLLTLLASTTGNAGLAVRQRLMPVLMALMPLALSKGDRVAPRLGKSRKESGDIDPAGSHVGPADG